MFLWKLTYYKFDRVLCAREPECQPAESVDEIVDYAGFYPEGIDIIVDQLKRQYPLNPITREQLRVLVIYWYFFAAGTWGMIHADALFVARTAANYALNQMALGLASICTILAVAMFAFVGWKAINPKWIRNIEQNYSKHEYICNAWGAYHACDALYIDPDGRATYELGGLLFPAPWIRIKSREQIDPFVDLWLFENRGGRGTDEIIYYSVIFPREVYVQWLGRLKSVDRGLCILEDWYDDPYTSPGPWVRPDKSGEDPDFVRWFKRWPFLTDAKLICGAGGLK